MVTCVICEQRPANGNGFCHNCDTKLEAKRKAKNGDKPKHFLTYRGHVVGLFHSTKGMLKAQLLKCNPDNLPKLKTLDLNRYCEGFTRTQIKDFKACVLRLANA